MTQIASGQNKWSLLIGIDRYPNLPPFRQLKGCSRDVDLMTGTLVNNFGFPEKNITLLKNEEATRAAILAAMDLLAKRTGRDDTVVIFYSGHGSQMRDREGDEADGWDETIVPFDSGREQKPNLDITDDEIYLRLLGLSQKTACVTLIFDCCHSETITRDAFGSATRSIPRDERSLKDLPPSPIDLAVLRNTSHDQEFAGWIPVRDRYVLISACTDQEEANEYRTKDGVNGALTYFLHQELVKAEPGTTYRDIFELASSNVTSLFRSQHPRMQGAWNRELFGVRDIEPMRFASVKSRKGSTIELGAGEAHGLAAGSQWSVYASGTKRITESTPLLGQVEITRVMTTLSEAKILSEASREPKSRRGAIIEGARAVETERSYGDMCLRVNVQARQAGPHLTRLTEEIQKSSLLFLTGDAEPTDVRVYLLPERQHTVSTDPVPQLGALACPTWAAVGQDGRLVMPVHLIDEPDATHLVCHNLKLLAQYRLALALGNASPRNKLKGKVDLIIKWRSPKGDWVPAEVREEGGYIIFEEDDLISLEVANRHTAPLYISILDFGLTSRVQLAFPNGASQLVAPGERLHIWDRDGEETALGIPEGFPFVIDQNEKLPVGGIETLKVFATLRPTDFSYLEQEGVKSLPLAPKSSESGLSQVLRAMLCGLSLKNLGEARLPVNNEWTTIQRSFLLRRRQVQA